jgi:hypothetical protein
MGCRSRVSGELAGSSESRRPSPQLGRAGPKLPAIGSSTQLGRRGGPRGQDSATLPSVCARSSHHLQASTPLGAPARRLHTRAPLCQARLVSGSRICSPPAACSMCHIYISARGHEHRCYSTKPIPVEAVAQNQYHCPGSLCWDVSGGAAGGRGWTSLTEGPRVARRVVEERGWWNGRCRTSYSTDKPVSDTFILGRRSGSRWDHGRTSSRGVCVCVHAPTSGSPLMLPLCR